MDRDTLQQYRKQLLSLRSRLIDELQRIEEAVQEDLHKPGDLSHVPRHRADGDSEGLDAEIAIEKNEGDILHDVRRALERIDDGSFGTCLDCGHKVADARLRAIPYTPRCLTCEKKREAS